MLAVKLEASLLINLAWKRKCFIRPCPMMCFTMVEAVVCFERAAAEVERQIPCRALPTEFEAHRPCGFTVDPFEFDERTQVADFDGVLRVGDEVINFLVEDRE